MPAPRVNSGTDQATGLFVPLQRALAPMRFLAIGVEHALLIPMKSPQHADPGHHRRPSTRGDEHQDLHRVLPFARGVLGLGELGDVGRSLSVPRPTCKSVVAQLVKATPQIAYCYVDEYFL